MSANGGPAETVTVSGREFKCTGDCDVGMVKGGWENEIQSNADGSARILKKRVPWKLTGVAVEFDQVREDHEFLEQAQGSGVDLDISVTYVSGYTYAGTGQIVGELSESAASASATLEFSGPGKLKRL